MSGYPHFCPCYRNGPYPIVMPIYFFYTLRKLGLADPSPDRHKAARVRYAVAKMLGNNAAKSGATGTIPSSLKRAVAPNKRIVSPGRNRD